MGGIRIKKAAGITGRFLLTCSESDQSPDEGAAGASDSLGVADVEGDDGDSAPSFAGAASPLAASPCSALAVVAGLSDPSSWAISSPQVQMASANTAIKIQLFTSHPPFFFDEMSLCCEARLSRGKYTPKGVFLSIEKRSPTGGKAHYQTVT